MLVEPVHPEQVAGVGCVLLDATQLIDDRRGNGRWVTKLREGRQHDVALTEPLHRIVVRALAIVSKLTKYGETFGRGVSSIRHVSSCPNS